MAAAFRAGFERGIRHFLAALEVNLTGIALILLSRHESTPVYMELCNQYTANLAAQCGGWA